MKSKIISLLLRILNSHWLNQSPCRYGYINNLQAFEYDSLRSEDRMQPGITVKEVLDSADRFMSCPLHEGANLVVLEDGKVRPADVWDLHQLRQSLKPKTSDTQ